MTEEEKIMELEKIKRQQEKNRRDELMAKQRIISYRMARERNRQQKMMIKQQQQQQKLLSQSQSQIPSNYSYSSYDNSRQASTIGQSQPHLLSSSASSSSLAAVSLKRYDSLTLEPLHDEYSKLLMQQQQQQQQQQSSIDNSEVGRISLKDVSLSIYPSVCLHPSIYLSDTFSIHL